LARTERSRLDQAGSLTRAWIDASAALPLRWRVTMLALAGALSACAVPTYFRSESSIKLELDPPVELVTTAAGFCLGDTPQVVNTVSAETATELRGHRLNVAIIVRPPSGAPDGGEPSVLVGLIAEGQPPALPPAWASTNPDQIVLRESGRSGSLEFSELPMLEPAPDAPPDMPPTDTAGWPQTVSGRISWECGVPREVPQP
jgi:hypothetical protein